MVKVEFGASMGYIKSCLKSNGCVGCVLTLNWKRKQVQAMDCSVENFKAHISALGIPPWRSLNTVLKTGERGIIKSGSPSMWMVRVSPSLRALL